MASYVGFETHLKNSPFLQYILSEENISFVKKIAENDLKDFHPDKKIIQITPELIKQLLLQNYNDKKYVNRGDMFSRIHQKTDDFRDELKQINYLVINHLVSSTKTMILEETQYRGFTPWKADLNTRQDKTTLIRTKKRNQTSFEPRY